MAEINICSSGGFTQDMAKEYSLPYAVPWKRQQRGTRANFCTPGTQDIPAPKDNLRVQLCYSQRKFLQGIGPENMAKHLSFSAPTGASWPISLCSLSPSVSMASFSSPLLTPCCGEKTKLDFSTIWQIDSIITSTILMKCRKNSWASCCRLVENSGCPFPMRDLNMRGAMPFCIPCK